MHANLCVLILPQFPIGDGALHIPEYTCVFPPISPSVSLSLMCSVLFFHLCNLSRRNLTLDFRFTLITAMFSIIFLSFSIPLASARDCCMLFLHPPPLPCCGTVKKYSQTSFADRRLFYRSSFYLIRRILASYHMRGDVKANEVRRYVADVNPLPYVCTLG